jgi:hypothetical protein
VEVNCEDKNGMNGLTLRRQLSPNTVDKITLRRVGSSGVEVLSDKVPSEIQRECAEDDAVKDELARTESEELIPEFQAIVLAGGRCSRGRRQGTNEFKYARHGVTDLVSKGGVRLDTG